MQTKAQNETESFCPKCLDESTSDTPGGISTVGGFGRKFYGKTERCVICDSVVRTLWWTLIDIPFIPRGSYRYISHHRVGSALFWARRTDTRWGQVWKVWLVGVALGALVIFLIINYGKNIDALFGK